MNCYLCQIPISGERRRIGVFLCRTCLRFVLNTVGSNTRAELIWRVDDNNDRGLRAAGSKK